MAKSWSWLLIALAVVSVLLMNIYCIPMHDELSYAFGGQSTPIEGVCPRIHSFADVVRQQYGDYNASGNGRVIIHGLAAIFSGYRLYNVFDVLNTFAWVLFVLLLMHNGTLALSVKNFIVAFAFCFCFLWYAESCSMNAVFALNYLWCPVLTLLMAHLWNVCRRAWWLPVVSFFYGWSQDAFVLPFVCAIIGAGIVRSLANRKNEFSLIQIVSCLAMIVGSYFLCFSPASISRADGIAGRGLMQTILASLAMTPTILLYVVPVVFLLIIAVILVKNIKRARNLFWESLEWWIYFVAGMGLYFICLPIAGNRLMMPWLMAGTIIIFRNRASICVGRGVLIIFVVASFLWLFISTGFQVACGLDNKRMLEEYKRNSQGITYRTPVPCPGYAAARGLFAPWHLSLFARELDRDVPPVFFTKKMYDDIYKNPEKFFASAERIDEKSGLWVNHSMPYCLLGRAGEIVPEIAKSASKKYFEDRSKSAGRQILPGRLKRMFPSEEDMLDPNIEEFEFCAEDGKRYVVYCGGEYVPKKIASK